ncbi:serine protease SP24D-like [Episyrphus balteatus]|uniref:serine protease SP24D-like n=1 Tax=Episyrphus balteatus TaxID=286459 RepID=UPI0024859AAD|nr:serine protease SP24D-like [Episyrphus balteatus]
MASFSPVVFVVALLSTLCLGSFASPTLRILGGNEVGGSDYPYMVSVRRDTAHVCGGSLISLKHVLTAAHCVSELGTKPVDASAITCRVGSKNQFAGGKLVPVEKITIHNSYGSYLNDIAILELAYKLDESAKIKPIQLADKSDVVTPGKSVAIAGWGRTETSGANAYKLQQSDATVLSASQCEDEIGYGYASCICVQNKPGSGACNGDAGGPAVYDDQLVGVGNFVIGACGTKYPDVYARVSHYYSWIISIIGSQQ